MNHLLCMIILSCLFFSSYSLYRTQQCFVIQESPNGRPVACNSQPPIPLAATTIVNLQVDYNWRGSESWLYGLLDSQGNINLLMLYCLAGQSLPGNYSKGQNISLAFTCHSLPRSLVQGDHIFIGVFFDQQKTTEWLQYKIPIEGYSTAISVQPQSIEKSQYFFKKKIINLKTTILTIDS